jgi:hypothetical protein
MSQSFLSVLHDSFLFVLAFGNVFVIRHGEVIVADGLDCDTRATRLDLHVFLVISMVLGSTLFAGANVNLVTPEASKLGVDSCSNPSSRTDTKIGGRQRQSGWKGMQ